MARSRRLITLGGRLAAAVTALPPGPLVIALSGGADSAAAAWAAREAGRAVRAVHVHHGLPGSERLASAASAVADRLDMALDTVTVSVPPGPSPEGQARAARYGALAGAARPGELVVTAHTADDQAETVLLRLLRGSGLDGLAGIPPERPPYVRPFLGVSRSETRELAALVGLPWTDDPANEDLRLLRNVVRRRVIPLLEGEVATGLRPSLARSAAVVRSELAVLDALADRIRVHPVRGGFRMAAGEVVAAEPAVAARAVRRALAAHRPPYPPGGGEVEAVLAAARGGGGADLGGGWRVSRAGASVTVTRSGAPADVPGPAPFPFPGSAVWGRFRFESVVSDRRPVSPLSRWALVVPVAGGEREGIVRGATRDDRIAVPGGRKRVFDALGEGGVRGADRERWPVVTLGAEVVWVPGVRRVGWRPGDGERYLCAVASVVDGGDESRSGAGEEEGRWESGH